MSRQDRDDLLAASREGILMDEITLDKLLHAESSETPAPFVDTSTARPSDTAQQASAADILGGRAAHVPVAVHERMLALAASGELPISSQAQRKRAVIAKNTQYGVPASLKDAFQYGYCHPNLPPPRGGVWQAQGGKWRLSIRGG